MSDRWHADLLSTIGNTPLIQLSRVGAGLPCPILGKVEFFNPGARPAGGSHASWVGWEPAAP